MNPIIHLHSIWPSSHKLFFVMNTKCDFHLHLPGYYLLCPQLRQRAAPPVALQAWRRGWRRNISGTAPLCVWYPSSSAQDGPPRTCRIKQKKSQLRRQIKRKCLYIFERDLTGWSSEGSRMGTAKWFFPVGVTQQRTILTEDFSECCSDPNTKIYKHTRIRIEECDKWTCSFITRIHI